MNFTKPIYGKLLENLSLRLKKTKNQLSDILDPSVTWIQSSKEAYIFQNIRKEINFNTPISTNVALKVEERHSHYFAESYAFSQASFEESLDGSLNPANAFVLEVRNLWGTTVPGPQYAWLLDVHARALRAHIKAVAPGTPEGRWVRALDWRSPYTIFGKGYCITLAEYQILVMKYRSLRAQGYPPVGPAATPARWNPYWRPNEPDIRNPPANLLQGRGANDASLAS